MADSANFMIPQMVIRSPEFKDVYTNATKLAASPFDFTMTFGRIIALPTGQNAVEELCNVRISPHQFINLLQSLQDVREAWEEAFGKIPQTAPPTPVEAIKSAIKELKEHSAKGGNLSC